MVELWLRADSAGNDKTICLAQTRELSVEIGQSGSQHLAMMGIAGSFELLQHALAREA